MRGGWTGNERAKEKGDGRKGNGEREKKEKEGER